MQSPLGQFLFDGAGDGERQHGARNRVMMAPREGLEFGEVEVLVVFDFDFLRLRAGGEEHVNISNCTSRDNIADEDFMGLRCVIVIRSRKPGAGRFGDRMAELRDVPIVRKRSYFVAGRNGRLNVKKFRPMNVVNIKDIC